MRADTCIADIMVSRNEVNLDVSKYSIVIQPKNVFKSM